MGMTEMIAWLRAQLDAEERIAREPTAPNWHYSPPLGGDGYLDFEGSFEVGEQEVETRGFDPDDLAHIADHDPARVLRQVQAHRAILDEHQPAEGWAHGPGTNMDRGQVCGTCAGTDRFEDLVGVTFPCATLRLIASIYSDRDGYRQEWSA